MEPVRARTLLPRAPPTRAGQHVPTRGEPLQPGYEVSESTDNRALIEFEHKESPGHEVSGPKRKRQRGEDESQRQHLPSFQYLLNPNTNPSAGSDEAEQVAPARLTRIGHAAYHHEGLFRFLAPPPDRDFPISLIHDKRQLSFPVVEPELMTIFRRAWYLRHYLRLRRAQGECWLDHIFFNDSYGIETSLYTWTSRYEAGTLQYPVSMLCKHCLWLFFHRTLQASSPSPAFTQVVEDGLHALHTLEQAVAQVADRAAFLGPIVLVPLFLLGVCAFEAPQRQKVHNAFERLRSCCHEDAVFHALQSVRNVWSMMDDAPGATTWEFESFQAQVPYAAMEDRSLIDLLTDPLVPAPAPAPAPQQIRPAHSPEVQHFDVSRFRPGQMETPPVSNNSTFSSKEAAHAVETKSSTRMSSTFRPKSPVMETPGPASANGRYLEAPVEASGHRPLLASPRPVSNGEAHAPNYPVSNLQPAMRTNTSPVTNGDYNSYAASMTNSQRKMTRNKSTVPPCSTCGKELKNPSDAAKHQLQHSKPYRCTETGCTRNQGFATENDLQRHRKSVHGASPRIGNKIGYVCTDCPDPSDGTRAKWWPRLDNFKAHIRRKHQHADEERLIAQSAKPKPVDYEISWEQGYEHPSTSSRGRGETNGYGRSDNNNSRGTAYVCVACPEPDDGSRPRLYDDLSVFRAHCRGQHYDQEEEKLIASSATSLPNGHDNYQQSAYAPMPNSWRGRNDAPPEVVTYRCAMCAEAFEGAVMQLYHDLDEFRAHCRSKHSELDTESLIAGSITTGLPEKETWGQLSYTTGTIGQHNESNNYERTKDHHHHHNSYSAQPTNRDEDFDRSNSYDSTGKDRSQTRSHRHPSMHSMSSSRSRSGSGSGPGSGYSEDRRETSSPAHDNIRVNLNGNANGDGKVNSNVNGNSNGDAKGRGKGRERNEQSTAELYESKYVKTMPGPYGLRARVDEEKAERRAEGERERVDVEGAAEGRIEA